MTAMTAEQLPRTAKHAIYIDEGDLVTVLWTPDPELAADPAILDRILDRTLEIEAPARARRFYKRESGFAGWVVEGNAGSASDPIRTKREAMKLLRAEVAAYFNR